MRIRAIVAALAVIVVSCGASEPSETSVTTTKTAAGPTTTQAAATATTDAPTTSAVPATTVPEIDVEVSGGEVTGPDTFEVDLGDKVDIWILSDLDDELHVHGYDLNFDLDAGVPLNLSFDADVPGLFEVEVHTGHTVLFEIEVTG